MNEIEKAVAFLEDAIRNLEKVSDFYGINQYGIKECQTAVVALREKLEREKNEPLTLDELRKMDGEPVWLHTFSAANKKTNISQWALVASSGDYSVSFIRVAVNGRLEKKCDDYGKTWLAYRHHMKGKDPRKEIV